MNRAALALVICLAAGCKDREPAAPAERPPEIPFAELERGRDACADYVARVCACAETTPAARQPCDLSRALPEAIEIGMQVASGSASSRTDVLHAAQTVRQTARSCIEHAAKLPTLGCPAPR